MKISSALKSVVLSALSLSLLIGSTTPASARVPLSTTQPVGGVNLRFVDNSRNDPWTGEGSRELPITITYPTSVTEGETLRFPDITSVAIDNAPVSADAQELPVVLFEPGYLSPRYAYSTYTEDLSARGYIVIAIDHTGESPVGTTFPDGRTVGSKVSNSYSEESLQKAIDVRVEDAQFILDTVEEIARGTSNTDADGTALPENFAHAINTSAIGMFGHSLGGATVTEMLLDDSRVQMGVNLDGALFYGSEPNRVTLQDPGKPLLQIMNYDTMADARGREMFWNSYFGTPRTSWHREYGIKGTGHMSFTDLESVVPDWVPPFMDTGMPGGFTLGSAPRAEVLDTVRGIMTAGFDKFLKGKEESLFEDVTAIYPLAIPYSQIPEKESTMNDTWVRLWEWIG